MLALASRCLRTSNERRQHETLGGMPSDQQDLVDRPALAETIDTTGPLSKPRQGPRQLEVHNRSAAPVQVQSFRRRVGGEQDQTPLVEGTLGLASLPRAHPAVEQHRGMPLARERALEVHERVAVLGEHDQWLAGPPREPEQEPQLGLVPAGLRGGAHQAVEQGTLASNIRQARRPDDAIRRAIVEHLLVHQGERELRRDLRFEWQRAEQFDASPQRRQQRRGAREGALAQDHCREARRLIRSAPRLGPDESRVSLEE